MISCGLSFRRARFSAGTPGFDPAGFRRLFDRLNLSAIAVHTRPHWVRDRGECAIGIHLRLREA